MGVQEARDLRDGVFAALGSARNEGNFGDIRRHGNRDAAEGLHPLGNQIDELGLLLKVFIKEKMNHVKRRT